MATPAKYSSNRRTALRTADIVAVISLAIAALLAACIALGGAALLLTETVFAAEPVPATPSDAKSGALLMKTRGGATTTAPLLHTDVDIRVSGMVARAVVRQTFRNPSPDWAEGIYVFPLPENAAVDHLKMRIGERLVEGEIQERSAAKKTYEEAKASGRRAALMEQERANIFTHSVANIGPNEEITVEIEYQQTLRYEAGSYALRFPMVVGPRYIPGSPVATAQRTGWSPNTNQVPDAARITPPLLRPGEATRPINPVNLKVSIDAGVAIESVDSPYHPVQVRRLDQEKSEIRLEDGQVASRDFELKWRLANDAAPRAALFTETKADKTYGLLMLMPPALQARAKALPREVIFVIDTSGSMHGESIAQAKEALEMAVRRLAPADRFNVIEFNSYARSLWNDARPADRDNTDLAARWVNSLKAQGGTEMAPALNFALNGNETPGRIRQVIFLTDGAIGNEDGLFHLISGKLGDSRLFTVGIGSAPNSHFMSKAAKLGRGSFTHIGKVGEVKEKMLSLFAKLESPVLKGLRVEWPQGAQVESWPARLPDLYLGEPLVVSFVTDQPVGAVKISGWRGETPWAASMSLDQAADGQGMGVLWAREKITALIDTLREGANEESVKPAVVQIALDHHLVSKYTSLVAVDKTPARPAEDVLKTALMPTNLPEGWSYEHVFGELPQGATDMRFNLLCGLLLMLTALLMARRRTARVWQ
ncbi:MAG: marine proteobacterial sortase target protein [Betaproteobacteria bacterium RIFCSPLOWO2_02_FULL_62_17]|nr:MAG: marine proteobacterial sortase target protein [Betaproteobacteria bacterium RIFCSPLOWO2_02_FULL_62_17]